ncbi:patatin-like phospholipase family protein [Paraferrimonas sedimenticola]|nr:patatin-like phospholipase family protein [Paraferrimonas sedimenticola]
MMGGGGARAAYQIGVLKAMAQMYPRNHGLPFQVLVGTSAGAINASSLACYASCFHLGVRKLEYIWRNMRTHQIYRCSASGLAKHLFRMWLRKFQSESLKHTPSSLFDNQPLRELLEKVIDFNRVENNLERGSLRALCVDTSNYNDSHAYSFYQAREPKDWTRARRNGQAIKFRYAHLMASTAIPMIFPAIKIGDHYHGDGSIHQVSPLSAPIHLGASKIIVVNLDSQAAKDKPKFDGAPRMGDILGHLLDTIFSDTLNSDLERLHRINHTINQLPQGLSTQGLRPIDTLVIKPSVDLGELALKHFHRLPWGVRLLMRLLGISKDSNSSLISYMLFEAEFCQELIELGQADALAQKSRLKAFFQRP